MELQNLNESVLTVIRIARSLATEYRNAAFSSGHILKALLNSQVGIRGFINNLGIDLNDLDEWATVRIEDYPKGSSNEINGDDKVQNIFDQADNVRIKLGYSTIDPICILCALSAPEVGFTSEQLKTFPFKERDILNSLLQENEIKKSIGFPDTNPEQSSLNSMLLKYCIDKTLLAKEKKIFPIVRREKELRTMVEILGRHSRPSVILTGEAGVGKTALVDGLACNIISGDVPSYLADAFILELDMGALLAGATYKGEVEDRLKNLIREIRGLDKAILFIDDIHLLLDTRSGNSGAGNILKQELSGGLTVIGATTVDEYRKSIETDQAFNRRFEEISVAEPDTDSAIAIINEVYPRYAQHHNITATKSALASCVLLSKRYIKDKKLPDAAIDLLDRTMSSVRIINETAEISVGTLKSRLVKLKKSKIKDTEYKLQALNALYFTLHNHLSPILLGRLPQKDRNIDRNSPDEFCSFIEQEIATIAEFVQKKITCLTEQEIASVIAAKTGIPVGKIQTGEKEKLMKMEDMLRHRVVGQDYALKVLADAILESRSGMNKPGQPIGSFFMLGPTGTGKTELAKALAEVLFNDERAMIRFDMSEFKEEHSAALLYGAPPGYVGYEEGGLLVNKIRRQPYAVVLFDEIEKAHPSVYDIFLQIMDEGKLHDRLGKEGDFSNAVILFTSNVGSEWLASEINQGKQPTTQQLMEVMGRYFRPEFLARLSEIVPFSPINDNMLLQIFNIRLNELSDLLERQQISIELTESARMLMATKDFNPKYGARQIAGTIRNQLRRPISRLIVSGEIGKGSVIRISTDKKKDLVWKLDK